MGDPTLLSTTSSDASSTKSTKSSSPWITTLKLLAVLALLYIFICSLDLLSVAFQLLAGKGAGDFLGSGSAIIENPIMGLMIGIMGTVILQSSSTFTSIVISMVGGDVLQPDQAVFIIMGANIGTSVTNTIVSLTQAADRAQFERAFSAATVHDMFNWCAVIVLLILEVSFHILDKLSKMLADALAGTDGKKIKILQYITEPLTHLIVRIEEDVLDLWAQGNCQNCTLLKVYCPPPEEYNYTMLPLTPDLGFEECQHFFNLFDHVQDWVAGLVLLIFSLAILCGALLLMVKLLNSVLSGALSTVINKVLNPKFKSKGVNYLWGYVNILVGAVMTFIVQSSSVFTCTMTPLVGLGLVEVDTCYPLFLGANIGTTTTSILAAMAQSGSGVHNALQASFVHLFFNLFGIALFYPIPFMRFPLPLCKALGRTTAKYRWFAVWYLIFMFLLMPLVVMALSLVAILFYVVMGLVVLGLIFIGIVNYMQNSHSKKLPRLLRDWEFLPEALHSLEPYDRVISKWSCVAKLNDKNISESHMNLATDLKESKNTIPEKSGLDNEAMMGF
ncbi:hypothetical protein TCAL_13780 [Tigriopus californicus]|uniref:Sodium-dependent phosphate transport protein 2B n=1 Tax=Tigriopus californicus TaxID=6832 RepID=A0A553NXH6_TIGCA|nr:sodium-dependent phosphate transport protein 2B-like [Tigriopus californicus]TRY70130.1 hypothetical protein TCAL_13780 [Tigriopus californicus]|eukprot:TCALIF_13780-PA protein Name:"Similar to Slc34a2 Sodium-dependent phosphate transport protein 2B (Rattus norvegicus)" AED:0.08 eAED:0.08 QI:0/1/0.71/1/1/1/7/397/558